MVIHYTAKAIESLRLALCGRGKCQSLKITTDRTKTTCKSCLRILDIIRRNLREEQKP